MTTEIRGMLAAGACAAAAVVSVAGCGGAQHQKTAAATLRADGYTVTSAAPPGQAQRNLGVVSLASGVKGSLAEEVIIPGAHPSAPVCKTSQVCTPASLVMGLRTQDPGTKASVDGMVVRITGLVATFRGDGLPV